LPAVTSRAAVDAGRFQQAVGYGVGRVHPHQVQPERADQRGQDDGQQGVDQADLAEEQVGRDASAVVGTMMEPSTRPKSSPL
jgi:hypothetical protein